MAKQRTARQIAASRQNIKKAQLASARKRRGKGRSVPTKPGRRNRVVAHIGRNKGKYGTAVGLVAVAGAGYATKRYLKNPKNYTIFHHRTTPENAANIKRTGYIHGVNKNSLSGQTYKGHAGRIFGVVNYRDNMDRIIHKEDFGTGSVKLRIPNVVFKIFGRQDHTYPGSYSLPSRIQRIYKPRVIVNR